MRGAIALLAISIFSVVSYGDIIGPMVRVEVQAGDDSGAIEFPVDLAGLPIPPQGLEKVQWALENSRSIFSDNNPGKKLGSLDALTIELDGDPAVSMAIAVTAGGTDATFTVTSASVSFPAMSNPDAFATAGVTVTDNNSNGATVTGLQAGGNLYEARYNTGVAWADLVGSFNVAQDDTDTSDGRQPASGRQTIMASVSQIEAEFKFTLTADDSLGATSRFDIIPEPMTLGMLGLGLPMLILRRRRR